MRRPLAAILLAFLALGLSACFKDSKQEILAKAEGAATRADLRERLGSPDDISKTGPIEIWTYEASNGTVSFTLAGDTVTISTTGEKR